MSEKSPLVRSGRFRSENRVIVKWPVWRRAAEVAPKTSIRDAAEATDRWNASFARSGQRSASRSTSPSRARGPIEQSRERAAVPLAPAGNHDQQTGASRSARSEQRATARDARALHELPAAASPHVFSRKACVEREKGPRTRPADPQVSARGLHRLTQGARYWFPESCAKM